LRKILLKRMNTGEIIKKAGLKVTPQRTMVYDMVSELGHCSIDTILAGVQQKSPEITVSTVYRILDSFCEAGIISKIACPNMKYLFDVTPVEHHHVFANNKVLDYTDPELTATVKKRLESADLFENLDIEKISIQIVATSKS